MATSDSPTQSKSEALFESNENDTRSADEPEFKEEVGGLKFDQYLTGGLGRHLGIFSTTSLMWDFPTLPEALHDS
jgi:hypothetical protein